MLLLIKKTQYLLRIYILSPRLVLIGNDHVCQLYRKSNWFRNISQSAQFNIRVSNINRGLCFNKTLFSKKESEIEWKNSVCLWFYNEVSVVDDGALLPFQPGWRALRQQNIFESTCLAECRNPFMWYAYRNGLKTEFTCLIVIMAFIPSNEMSRLFGAK